MAVCAGSGEVRVVVRVVVMDGSRMVVVGRECCGFDDTKSSIGKCQRSKFGILSK